MRDRLAVLALAALPRLLLGQGVTTAAIQGTVVDDHGSPIPRALIQVTNTLDGRRWDVTTSAGGGYLLEDVAVGGPYRIDVRALGFGPVAKAGIVLALGQRLPADFTLRPAAVELDPVTADALFNPVLNPGRTGPAEIISARRIAALPNIGRDFLTLTLLSPQTALSPSSRRSPSGGLTIGGHNRLLNAFQIDGGMNQDPYTGRLPGRETLPRPISLEAIQEIQVLVAPFDVRYSGFSGGLMNAVTKTGTNVLHGSVFAYLADASLVGRDLAGDRVESFATWQYGGTINGPIVRDRGHFFLGVDVQHRVVPDPGPLITDTAGGADLANIGIRYTSATRLQSILRDTYGLDPGTLGPSEGKVPATDVFGKITVQLGRNSHLEISHHYTNGERMGFVARQRLQYHLTSFSRRDPATANASRLLWTSLLGGRWSNEVIASHLRLRDACRPTATYPTIRVRADSGFLLSGTQAQCSSAFTLQNAYEVTENVTTAFGPHVLSFGTRFELLRLEDGHLLGEAGVWEFSHLDSLEAGHASRYSRSLLGPSAAGVVEFQAHQFALYLQDRWNPVHQLTLTAGLRIDVTLLPGGLPTYVPLKDALGFDTRRLPRRSVIWSPRFSLNYDPRGQGHSTLRGGVGLFSGRIPYNWLASSYRDNGSQLLLTCDGQVVPPFDPINQPSTCKDGSGGSPRLSFFDSGVKLPQDLKISLGADQLLSGGVVGTVDVVYTHAVHQMYLSAANLPPPVGVAEGEGYRPMYGTINTANGSATPDWLAPTFGQVIRTSNRSGDASLVVAVQMRKRVGERGDVSALYAYTRARDRMSIANFQPGPNLVNTPLDGTLDNRRLSTSFFEIPHRVEIDVLARLPYRLRLALQYAGASGTPFTYTINGDANADGMGESSDGLVNDIVYVPRNRADIALDGNGRARGFGTVKDQDSVYAALDRYIRGEPCLENQRGRIMARNSCRNPWFGTLNARITKTFPTLTGHSLELTADIYNVLNLVNQRWGQSRVTASNPPAQPLLLLTGYDPVYRRGIYSGPIVQNQIQDLASRWQMELSLRYIF